VNDDPSENHDAFLPDLIYDNGEEGDGPSTDWDMGDHLTLHPKSKLQKLLAENRNFFTFTMDNMTTIQGETFKVTLTNDTPTLYVLGPATLRLGGGFDSVKDFQSVRDDDTVVFHPIKADENEAKPSLDSQAIKVAPQQGQQEAITEMAPPTTVSGLRAFLGTAGYYRRYVPNFHCTTVPLNALLQSGVVWEWTPEAQQAFEELKAKLTIKAQSCEVCHDTAVNSRTGVMLLCDNCNTGWHIKCLTPPLRKKPAEDWFCSRCPVASQKEVPTFNHHLIIFAPSGQIRLVGGGGSWMMCMTW
jgi:hypothetical protein